MPGLGGTAGAPAPEPRPAGPPIKALNQSQMPTLPTGTPAPRLASQAVDPAPTVPMRLARLPEALAAARNTPTMPSVGASNATLRAESKVRLRVVVLTLLLLGVALLIGGAYLWLRSTSPPPAIPAAPPDAAMASPAPAAAEPVDAGPPRSPPETATEEPTAPRPPVRPQPSSEDPLAGHHRSTLQVTFIRKRPSQTYVSCGTPPRQCTDTCTITVGEVCQARSPGYQPKRMTFEELKGRGNRVRARVEVKLTPTQ
jgi:hypothetical protein